MNWYSSDFHLGHYNIIKYCNRPFFSIEEMNNKIYDIISSTCKSNDNLIHLGDLMFKNKDEITKELDKLNCNILNIKGNHDGKLKYTIGNSILKYNFANQNVVLFEHKPSNECHHKNIFKALDIKICICGHVHNHDMWKFEDIYAAYDPECDVININIGIDCTNFKLIDEPHLMQMILKAIKYKNKLHTVFNYRDNNNNHIL